MTKMDGILLMVPEGVDAKQFGDAIQPLVTILSNALSRIEELERKVEDCIGE